MERMAPASAETHISWVLMNGERAFKIYKPVATDVLDHRDAASRRSSCEREVALNARMAPDVYEGVGQIVIDGSAIEPVVVMRQMPASRRLSSLLDEPEASCRVREAARAVARFHSALAPLDPDLATGVASRAALEDRWARDLAGLADVARGRLTDPIREIERLAGAYLAGREPMLDLRIASGMVRDGHGDLLADDIFCLPDGPRILDCLAFSDTLRWGDVLADAAFLVMDLQRLGHPELARALLHAYCEFSGEHHPGSLAHFYVAQRALVRAKVAALRAGRTASEDPKVAGLVGLVADHLRRAEVRLALVGGLPGSGKSTLAGRMADEFGWTVLSSDEVRRDLGLRYHDLQGPAAYAAETVAAVYAEMRRRAEHLLGHGISVILDATWSSAAERSQARALAALTQARLLEVRCHAPTIQCRARVGARSSGALSEATPEVVDLLASRADRWPEAIAFDTAGSEPSRSRSSRYFTEAAALWWRSQPAMAGDPNATV